VPPVDGLTVDVRDTYDKQISAATAHFTLRPTMRVCKWMRHTRLCQAVGYMCQHHNRVRPAALGGCTVGGAALSGAPRHGSVSYLATGMFGAGTAAVRVHRGTEEAFEHD
jgi:hypothetical protein